MENRIKKLIEEVASMSVSLEPACFGSEYSKCPFCGANRQGWVSMLSMHDLKHEEGCTWLLARELYINGVGDDEKHQEV